MILAEAGTDPQLFQYLGVFFLTLVVIAFAVGSMLASKLAGWYFGARKAKALGRHTPTKDTPYECGMLPVGDGSSRMSVKFYLVAMLFILFDIEVVFLYPWAVVYKEMLGNPATANVIFGTMVSFLGILFVGYIYAIKKNAFDWKS
ncbi:MAG: NADH-quinone oxidoreductase subunit A [Verrucomicrobiota bacterium]|jgi:NADH-quinone oxidoreductase subunit A|nr:NADH-quinone oxidoreductase subunit A [Verrucomicrobiota bacterium]MDP7176772.1 NADH-quinone oxidoreductase subunit A [Verrucomicrobiota bacterium]MDP7440166.1 NADH-quinone oxidoreductase subunit A [Verrucomicrobiota bacterium]HJN82515.1 NADH-quinone oxidoreductase subunit A [Verrucomicrobiota bacterium]|tara:strand:+ start:3280 stop:3717 length:438 start_codon:yes stop_codon:yes gene_type:complete